MAVSPLLAPGALSAYTGLSEKADPSVAGKFRLTAEPKNVDRVTISDEAKELIRHAKPKIPDDVELRTLTRKLVEGNRIRDFLSLAFQSRL